MTSGLGAPIDPTDLIDGKYALLSPLGGGNFGEVWHSRHVLTGRESALKIMNMEHSTPEDAWTEATRLTRLESDYLVRVYGAGQTADVAYIDMALAAGGSAGARAGSFGISPRLAIEWIGRVADGLHLCHEHGLLHRDVKPDNILLDAAGHALLGDFGATGVMDAIGETGPHGDIHIVAPEVFSTNRCSRATDVYSLGVSMIALIGGRLPFLRGEFSTQDEFVASVQKGLPDVRDALPQVGLPLAKVIATAVHVDPSQRYASAAAFRTALNRLSAPKRDVVARQPHHPGGFCWDATGSRGARDVHVCAEPSGANISITSRFTNGGSRIRQACGSPTIKESNKFLRKVFKAIQ